jgi:hypothetical protein
LADDTRKKLLIGIFAVLLNSFGLSALAAEKSQAEDAISHYMSNGNGKAGGFVSFSGIVSASLGDLETPLTSKGASAVFDLGTPTGGVLAVGYDWGKIRFDWRVGGMKMDVDAINGLSTINGSESAVGFSTVNLSYDIYQFDIYQYGMDAEDTVSITPFVGGGVGAALGWTNGKQNVLANGILDRDKFDIGMVYSAEAGLYLGLASWAGVNLSYNYLTFDLGDTAMDNHIGLAGLRFTY